jgi:hypothetical protein
MMKRDPKAANELKSMMLEQARRFVECLSLSDQNIYIHQSNDPHTNWGYGTVGRVSEECRRALDRILGELRLEYDMKE